METVRNVEEICDFVRSSSRVRLRGGGTKSAGSSDANVSVIELSGVVDYAPSEFTFTARAGTRVADIERILAEQGQFLPFDPPLKEAGATLGGTVAAGLSGSGRFRYGGIRDFILGARIVTGDGQVVTSGSKVVKNAARFDLHKLMVGSLGSVGILTEITLKVFPAPQTYATLWVQAENAVEGMKLVKSLATSQLDLHALDLDASNRVWIRLGGYENAVAQRASRVMLLLGQTCQRIEPALESQYWSECGEFHWLPAGFDLIKVATVPDAAVAIGAHFARLPWRICVGGNLMWIGVPQESVPVDVDRLLRHVGCAGSYITGTRPRPYLGAYSESNVFAQRLLAAFDPDRKFALNTENCN